jgi:multicomponent Na+:H+ antiporter subunit C
MELMWAIVIGALYAAGLYLMMRRSIVKIILGLVMLGHAANLLIFTVGKLTRGAVPLIAAGEQTLPASAADPLPQALILTAIVIGFGVQAFAMVLFKRLYQRTNSDDVDYVREIEESA